MTGAEFVRQVMRQLGVDSATGLAGRMRWPRGIERTISRWLAGESEPSFAYTFEMGRKAGFLNMGEALPADQAVPDDLLAELARNDAELLANQAQALEVLQRMHVELAHLAAEIGTTPTRQRRKK